MGVYKQLTSPPIKNLVLQNVFNFNSTEATAKSNFGEIFRNGSQISHELDLAIFRVPTGDVTYSLGPEMFETILLLPVRDFKIQLKRLFYTHIANKNLGVHDLMNQI